MLKSLKKVFRKKAYWMTSSSIAFFVFIFVIYLPNFKLIGTVLASDKASFGYKISFLTSLLGGLSTNNTLFSILITMSIAVLLGINMSMLVYMIKANKKAVKKSDNAIALGGAVGGIIGIGCAACGSLILTPLLLFLGAGSLLSILPLHGVEFGLLGAILLIVSIKILGKKINDPLVCPID